LQRHSVVPHETSRLVSKHDAQVTVKDGSPAPATPQELPGANPWGGGRDRRRPHPSPRARVLLMVAIVIGVLVAFTLLIWLALQVNTLTDRTKLPSTEELARAIRIFRILAVTMSVSVLGVSIWIGHFAWRVVQAGVYPPPGSRHLRVRRVLRGPEARRVAVACFVVGGLLAVVGACLAPLVFRLLSSLGLDSA
jgi:hypothetical protein